MSYIFRFFYCNVLRLITDKLKISAPSRIVNVSSVGAHLGKLNRHNLNEYPKTSHSGFASFFMYCNAKLCQILFTRVLGEKLKGTGVNVYALHPGLAESEMFRKLPTLVKEVVLFLVINLSKVINC